MSNRLIALDKNPGVRPIGIGECLRRIIAKSVLMVAGHEVTERCGADQLCGGLNCGIEGGIHFMKEKFQENCGPGSRWGMIMVDADNAFNRINRIHAVWQARCYWPKAAQFVYNVYKEDAELVTPGSKESMFSREGVTQGDPLSMLLYGLATMPLIQKLESPNTYQAWYADDSSCQGKLEDVMQWWEKLQELGPSIGYFPQPRKTYLVVHPDDVNEASAIFRRTGITIVDGMRFLGGFVGSLDGQESYVGSKVKEWSDSISKLAEVGKLCPQSAYTVASKSLQAEWNFLQRVTNTKPETFQPLTANLRKEFFPAIIGGPVTDVECQVFHLPVREGGLGLPDPAMEAAHNYRASLSGCEAMIKAMTSKEELDIDQHTEMLRKSRLECKKLRAVRTRDSFNRNEALLPSKQRRAVRRASNEKAKTGGWLSCIPLHCHNLDLSPSEFRDGLALRYGRSPVNLPEECDGCGERYTVEHGLSCRLGGLIIRRHNEVRDSLGDLMELAWGNCIKEPVVDEAGDGRMPALRADLACRGVWEPQTEALFDVRVMDTDAPSYGSISPETAIKRAEQEKKRKYLPPCERRHASFTPLVTSLDGFLGSEFQTLLRALAERLVERWQRPYSQIINWIRVRVTCSIIRAGSMCLRRGRRRWRSVHEFSDGAGVPMWH